MTHHRRSTPPEWLPARRRRRVELAGGWGVFLLPIALLAALAARKLK